MNKEQNNLKNILFFNEMFKKENYMIGATIGKHLSDKNEKLEEGEEYKCESCGKELVDYGDYDEREIGICYECTELSREDDRQRMWEESEGIF